MNYLVEGSWFDPRGPIEPGIFYELARRLEGKGSRGVYWILRFPGLAGLRRLR